MSGAPAKLGAPTPVPALTTASAGSVLQRSCGCGNRVSGGGECQECKKNKTVQRYAAGAGGTDFAVSQPGDALEHEADAAAALVAGVGPMPAKPSVPPPTLRPGEAAQSVRATLDRAGEPLPDATRAFMEAGFGRDFSAVRVHRDPAAARSAAAIDALAYTSGNHVVFGAGQYLPETSAGRRLIAHELAHVAQQTALPIGRLVARKGGENDPPCLAGHKLGERTGAKGTPGDPAIYYVIWGTWKEGDNPYAFFERVVKAWIPWRFGGISATQSANVYTFLRNVVEMSGASGSPGCQSAFGLDYDTVVSVRKLSGEPQREAEAKRKEEEAQASAGGTAAPKDNASAGGGVPTPEKKDPAKEQSPERIGDFGPLSEAVAENKQQDNYVTTRIKADNEALKEPARAALYLKILEHFAGRAISDADKTAAADGLDAAEVEKVIDGKPMRKALTALFGQGWNEFHKAGGTELNKFQLLEFLVCEQFTRGNPTATHNQLMLGEGAPEKGVLGIAERNTGILLYDDLATPLPGFGGVGFRDKGYIASRKDDQWGFNIANVADPGLRSLLNSLRQTFGDPVRMAVGGAEVYFNNIEIVNKKVVDGLTEVVKQKFLDMLPFFVGFIAGHAVSAWLMRVPNPHVAAVGLALKGLLTAAGYIMDIEFAAGALERLMRAAAHLSHFERNEKGEVTQLSEAHLTEAAKVIQDMVAEIAALFATMALGKLVSSAHKGLQRLRIECTHCELKGPGTTEAKSEAKPEAKPEVKPEGKEPGKAEAAKEVTPEAAAKEKLAKLTAEKATKESELASLRQQRDNLTKEYNDAIQARKDAVVEWDAAAKRKDAAGVEAARAKARAAGARAERALEARDELPGEASKRDEIRDLDKGIEVEGIKADPNSRAKLPCFAAGSLVATPDGTRTIESLTTGDRVWAYDFATGRREPQRVLQLHCGRTDGWYRLVLHDGSVRATSGHRFWVDSELAWRDARTLVPGMRLAGVDGRSRELVAIERESDADAATYNLSVDNAQTYYVGPGVLVHNEPVDIGLGGGYIIYRGTYHGTNPDYRNWIYIGQTTVLDARGKPRGTQGRGNEHRGDAITALERDRLGIERLSDSNRKFYEFMKDVKLEPIIKGIATQEQADYLEQQNIEIERKVSGKENVANRKNQITSDSHKKEVAETIRNDPAVRKKGYCP